jgi:HJR/Mrr/RecB family endonuclease
MRFVLTFTCPNPRSKTSDIVNATKLTGIEFELFVKHQLIKSGYVKVETTRQSGDMGAHRRPAGGRPS